ncbi:hypothetical protein T4B_5904 [Trichinella pseudospiralis]|uniref:Uncharacterized protein n=1 Tax=Trichinella pseudospiralis TaxID=6337 RepID=A0A0V1K1V8_TRIPS|nr:hypothetical protein T4B_5904 [Trichinella pseudospiralis]KRZ41257.1 hypothetical protein T4C_1179 [Trichinella pseudospiralis]
MCNAAKEEEKATYHVDICVYQSRCCYDIGLKELSVHRFSAYQIQFTRNNGKSLNSTFVLLRHRGVYTIVNRFLRLTDNRTVAMSRFSVEFIFPYLVIDESYHTAALRLKR